MSETNRNRFIKTLAGRGMMPQTEIRQRHTQVNS